VLELHWVLLALAAVSSALAVLGFWNYRRIPALSIEAAAVRLPSLSIIVPARDEESNLRRLLPSLTKLNYPGELETIVVDDGSRDGTARVAESFDVKVLRLDHLPSGWLGKPYACHRGAQAAAGDWLLFTDADTAHTSNGPASAVSFARQNNLDGLSLVIDITSDKFPIRSALWAAFAGLFAATHGGRKLINGQYLLMEREFYQSIGGFAAVSDEPLEDLALGRVLQKGRHSVPTLRGDSVARVYMYPGYHGLWNGLGRIGAGSLKWLGASGLLSVLLIATAVTPLWGIVGVATQILDIKWAVLLWLVGISGFIPWAVQFGSGWHAVFIPFGSLIVLLSSMWGLIRILGGFGLVWKGRAVKPNPRADEG